jgi:hypothetical protein
VSLLRDTPERRIEQRTPETIPAVVHPGKQTGVIPDKTKKLVRVINIDHQVDMVDHQADAQNLDIIPTSHHRNDGIENKIIL